MRAKSAARILALLSAPCAGSLLAAGTDFAMPLSVEPVPQVLTLPAQYPASWVVRPQSNNDTNGCLGTQSAVYTCSTAVIVGIAITRTISEGRCRGRPPNATGGNVTDRQRDARRGQPAAGPAELDAQLSWLSRSDRIDAGDRDTGHRR